MIKSGDELYNPVTRTRVVFLNAAADNGGRAIVVDWFVPPGEALPMAPHYHAGPEGQVAETFDILSGTAEVRIGRRRRILTAPATFDIGFNQTHVHPRNAGESELHVRQRAEPAVPAPQVLLRLQNFFETYMALSQQGKANRRGDIINPLQMALTFREFLLDPTYLPVIPRGAQAMLFGGLAGLARRRGYRAYHRPAVTNVERDE